MKSLSEHIKKNHGKVVIYSNYRYCICIRAIASTIRDGEQKQYLDAHKIILKALNSERKCENFPREYKHISKLPTRPFAVNMEVHKL